MERARHRVVAVVPARDEARHIEGVVRSMPAEVHETIVVNDGSVDDTASRAARAGAHVLNHPQALGVGAAIAAGYDEAWRRGATVAVVLAGDGQMDPRDLPGLLAAIDEGADYAKGNRLSWPGVLRRMPLQRLVGNVALSWLTRRVSGLSVYDSQCGYTAITRRAAALAQTDRMWPRYGYPNDLICRLAAAGCVVEDVPVRPIYADETSGVRLRDAVLVVPGVLLRAYLRTRVGRRSRGR